MLDDAQKLSPDPIEEITVEYNLYERLLTKIRDEAKVTKNQKHCLGSLFGVKILIDPELKPNECKLKYA